MIGSNSGGANPLTTLVARIFFAGFDAGGGGDPDNGDEGDEAERQMRVLEGERDRYQIDEKGEIGFVLDCFVFCFEFACVAQAAADGQAQEEKAETGEDHGNDVDRDRKRVHLLLKDVGGEKRQQREAKEEAEVGVQNEFVGLLGAVDQVVVIDPVNAGEGKGDQVEAKRGKDGAKTGESVLMRDFEFEHHDGDDDGDDSVGEGFETSWGGDVMSHGVCA
jgi:hypothetical protein